MVPLPSDGNWLVAGDCESAMASVAILRPERRGCGGWATSARSGQALGRGQQEGGCLASDGTWDDDGQIVAGLVGKGEIGR